MGALGGGRRAAQFQERYASIDELYHDEEAGYNGGSAYDSDSDSASVASSSGGGPGALGSSTPAFFYGTHYSCAGYVSVLLSSYPALLLLLLLLLLCLSMFLYNPHSNSSHPPPLSPNPSCPIIIIITGPTLSVPSAAIYRHGSGATRRAI